jgi:hypothetical protein
VALKNTVNYSGRSFVNARDGAFFAGGHFHPTYIFVIFQQLIAPLANIKRIFATLCTIETGGQVIGHPETNRVKFT